MCLYMFVNLFCGPWHLQRTFFFFLNVFFDLASNDLDNVFCSIEADSEEASHSSVLPGLFLTSFVLFAFKSLIYQRFSSSWRRAKASFLKTRLFGWRTWPVTSTINSKPQRSTQLSANTPTVSYFNLLMSSRTSKHPVVLHLKILRETFIKSVLNLVC